MQKDIKVSMAPTDHRQAKLLAWHWGASLKDTLGRAVSQALKRVEENDPPVKEKGQEQPQPIRLADELSPEEALEKTKADLEKSWAEQKALRQELERVNEWLDREQSDRQEARDLAVQLMLPKEKRRFQATKQEVLERFDWLRNSYQRIMEEGDK